MENVISARIELLEKAQATDSATLKKIVDTRADLAEKEQRVRTNLLARAARIDELKGLLKKPTEVEADGG